MVAVCPAGEMAGKKGKVRIRWRSVTHPVLTSADIGRPISTVVSSGGDMPVRDEDGLARRYDTVHRSPNLRTPIHHISGRPPSSQCTPSFCVFDDAHFSLCEL